MFVWSCLGNYSFYSSFYKSFIQLAERYQVLALNNVPQYVLYKRNKSGIYICSDLLIACIFSLTISESLPP